MTTLQRIAALVLCFLVLLAPITHAQTAPPSLRGVVTDPSGSFVPNAMVQLRGPGGERRNTTDDKGNYAFPALGPGKYNVRVIAKGFTVSQKSAVDLSAPAVLDVQLTIEGEAQVLNVEDEANAVSADPSSNGSALVLREKELAALSDDPDELSQQLQAMAGPGAGPSGGQIYIDGFTGGQMPAKSSIREVRINSNPFSPEYDRPGFGRIEILTKPGTDFIRGQAFFQFNDQYFNSRSPLLTQSTRPPYEQKFYGLNLSGPIKKQKASYSFDFERRDITENAFILATTLDSAFHPQAINQAIITPQTRTNISPRVDYALNATNTLIARYQYTRSGLDNEGVGNFSLASQGYNQASTENTLQLTETAILNPVTINETRFQFSRTALSTTGASTAPAISVQGAFVDGGATVGNSGNTTTKYELSNITTLNHKTHTYKWGARARQSYNNDTAETNFNGTYSFFGGVGPELDASNRPIAGTSEPLTALDVYQRVLIGRAAGLSNTQIAATLLGTGRTQFAIGGGVPTTSIRQFDIGLFANDDWKIKPNLTLSYGLRYETQSNIHDLADISPRLGVAWGIDGHGTQPAKTVLRAGFGVFYDRLADSSTLQELRYNGITQQSYQILNPDFYPNIPSLSSLAAGRQPQNLQYLYDNVRAPRNYQANVGIDRQINKYARISANYIASRGVHLLRSRDINAPVNGVYPFGDKQVRFLSEAAGFSRTNQFFISPNINYKKIFLFGFYSLSYGKDDNEGQPANPYNLRAEWGPSTFADVRHRAIVGTNLPLVWKFTVAPFISMNSGAPFNITTGRNVFGDGVAAGRPALLSNVLQSSCTTTDLIYEPGYGCFNLNPSPGTATITRNYGRGPANFTINLRLSRTWSFGRRGESGPANQGPPPGGGGMRGGPGGGGPPPGGGGGPGMMFGGGGGGSKYNLSLSLNARNALNHPNYAAPSGDLSSPYFGVYRSLASGFGPGPGGGGASSTYNRKIDVQLRFTF